MKKKTEKIETIAEAHKRLICKAMNKCNGSIGQAYPLLAPKGQPTIRGLYNLMNKLGVKKDKNGKYV